jgi:hypothetical protein
MICPTSPSVLMNIMVLTKFTSEMAKVCPSLILVSLPYLLLLVSLNYLNFSMYPKFKKILSLLTSLLVIIKCLLNFIPPFFCVKDLYTGTLLLKGPGKDGLYTWPASPSLHSSPAAFIGERVSLHQWHYRLGHPASPVVQRILSRTALPIASTKQSFVCPACQQGKLHKLHFGLTFSVSKHHLNLMFLDVWGPAPVVSSNDHRYFLSVVDDFRKYIWLFPMACKSDVTTVFIKFKRIVENFFSRSIKSIQTDGGGEFIPLQRFLHIASISYRQTCPHTLISLELLDSRLLNLHLLDLVCVVYITFCCSFVLCLIFRS